MQSTKRLMVATWFLNIYDAIVTIYATQKLGVIEGNPLMRLCLASSVLLFVALKILVLTLVVRVLKRRYERRPVAIRRLTIAMFAAFVLVGLWNTAVVILVLTF